MENIILTGMLKDFVQRHELSGEQTDRQFEMFANYCLLKTDHYDSFEFEKVGTGDCVGVDGVAISIGGVIVDEIEDAQVFTKTQFEARFLFSQSKTSSKFDFGDFLKFVATVKIFFGTNKSAGACPEFCVRHNMTNQEHLCQAERSRRTRRLPPGVRHFPRSPRS